MKKIGVVLAGCGNMDGSEIREAVFTLLEIDRNNGEAVIMAPNIEQYHVIHHPTGDSQPEKRNVLSEAGRIARGNIRNITTVSPDELDALILPGGFGVAKNLSTFAHEGTNATVNEDLATLIKKIHSQKKPIGAICIAPALIALTLHKFKPHLTLGPDEPTNQSITSLGVTSQTATAKQIILDEANKLVTTSAYMDDNERLVDIHEGIAKCVKKVIEWC